jgi:hypothetical protein
MKPVPVLFRFGFFVPFLVPATLIASVAVLGACTETPSDFPPCVDPDHPCPAYEAGAGADSGPDADAGALPDAGDDAG